MIYFEEHTGLGGEIITISQMKYFLEVCKHMNVTRASETLHISQPSISNSIRDLEDELGVNLFHRVKMRLSLTKEGEIFQERCGKILSELDLLYEYMKDLGNKRNRIRLGVPPMIGTFLFPSIFEGFREAYPDIEIEIAEYGSRKIREMIINEALDIAIAIAEQQKDTQFNALPILKTTLLFAVDATHELSGQEAIRLEELDGRSIVQFQDDSDQTIILNDRFSRLNIRPKVLLASSQLYTIKKIIANGKAGAFLFREIASQEPDIVGIPLADPIVMDICLIWKKGRHMFSDTTKLLRFVQDIFCKF